MERYGCFGGVLTTVGMETLAWYRYEGTEDCKGSIGLEMERVAKNLGASRKFHYNDSECLDAERFKSIADALLLEAKVRPLLHCHAVGVIFDEVQKDQINAVITESKSGRQAILVKSVVDCTGDADVAWLAGCPYTKINSKESLGLTAVFNVAGVDKSKFLKHVEHNPKRYSDWGEEWVANAEKERNLKSPYLELPAPSANSNMSVSNSIEHNVVAASAAGVQEIKDNVKTSASSSSSTNNDNKEHAHNSDHSDHGHIADEDAPHLSDDKFVGSWSSLSDQGEATNLNLVHLSGLDATNVKDLTTAEIEGRKGVLKAITSMRENVPGFEASTLRNHAMTIGIRDSRKILGKYNMTGDDVCKQGRFLDAVGVFPEFVDGYSVLLLPTTGRFFHVPLGSLIPKEGASNLLVGGRCVAGDNVSHASIVVWIFNRN